MSLLLRGLLVSSLVYLALATSIAAQPIRVEARLELPQTIEPAGQDNPPCGNPAAAKLTAGDLVIKAGAAAIDAYIGAPVTSTILGKKEPGNQQWLRDRLGTSQNNGKASCATQCIAYPRNVSAKLDACLTESGGDGAHCFSATGNSEWGRVENFTRSQTDKANVFCATGKNWSHNRNRWFVVRAAW